MKKVIEFLEKNEIEYSLNKYGNPYYFNDGFSVEGIQVAFYFDGIGNSKSQEDALVRFMRNKKSYQVKRTRFGAGYTYRIMNTFDSIRLEKHEKAVADAVEKFWEKEHEKRMRENRTA